MIKHSANLLYLNLRIICKTCRSALKWERLPAQAKANNLVLELSELNPLETHLISLWIPFMKMVALPCGKQHAIHGPAINVPTDLTPVCTLLPRFPLMVPMKLMRKLCYKGHALHVPVHSTSKSTCSPTVVETALYKDVEINRDWLSDAPQDDAEL